MKFSAKQDVDAPIAFVYAFVTDFDMWERSAMRRGAEVTRIDTMRAPGVGAGWQARFPMRGKLRELDLQIVKMVAPKTLGLTAKSTAIESTLNFDMTEMSQRRSKLVLTLDLTPRNLTARLFVQSMRLARARVDRRFAARLAQIVTDIETAYRSA